MMLTLAEIQSKCTPAEIASGEHGLIAAKVSVDRKQVQSTLGGVGIVMEALGPTAGAALLDTLEAMSTSVPAVKWAFVLINRGELDFGSTATRAMIDQLVTDPAAAAALKAVAEVPAPVSVAEVIEALKGA